MSGQVHYSEAKIESVLGDRGQPGADSGFFLEVGARLKNEVTDW